MTRISNPDLISCPYCSAIHERVFLQSFSFRHNINYSDGGCSVDPAQLSGLITRCTSCKMILTNYTKLPKIGEVLGYPQGRFICWYKLQVFKLKMFLNENAPFGLQRLFTLHSDKQVVAKAGIYPRLPWPELPEWLDAIAQNNLTEQIKEHCQLQAMFQFNQLLVTDETWQIHHFQWKEMYRAQHLQIEETLLVKYEKDGGEVNWLICADIYRRRGWFNAATACLNKVTSEQYSATKNEMTAWITQGNTKLMALNSVHTQSLANTKHS